MLQNIIICQIKLTHANHQKLEISSKLACLLWSSTHSGLRLIVRQDLKAIQEKREREREERTESWRRRDQVEVGLRAPYV